MIKDAEIEALYNEATKGKAVPVIAYLTLGNLRVIAKTHPSTDIRSDVAAMLADTSLSDEERVELTRERVRVL